MTKLVTRIAAVALMTLPLAACGGGTEKAARPEVVAGFYPLQFVAERIVGGHAKVENLTAPGVEPHDLELTVRQTAQLASADVAIYEHGLQPSVDKAIKNDPPKATLNVSDVVQLAHETVRDADGQEEVKGGIDPHFWQDPTLLAKVADSFTARMVKSDPAHAADFRANNQKLQADLTKLDTEFREGLATCETRSLVTSHDAFGYLGRRYNLSVYSIAGLSPDAEPSPKHLAQLSHLIKQEHVTTVFAERLGSRKLSNALAKDLDLRSAVLDPLEGLTADDPKANYLSLMRANLKAIQKADSCS